MDLRVDDDQIIPLRYRLVCDLKQPPEGIPWSTDARGLLAYSDEERDAIVADLTQAKVPYTLEAVDQPDPAHLALLQGAVTTRADALAALTALGKGETPEIAELQLKQLQTDVADLKAAKEVSAAK